MPRRGSSWMNCAVETHDAPLQGMDHCEGMDPRTDSAEAEAVRGWYEMSRWDSGVAEWWRFGRASPLRGTAGSWGVT